MPPNRRRARHDGMFHEATAKAKSEAGACAGDDVPPQNRCRQVVRFLFATHAKATAGFTYELECIIVFRVDLHVLLFPSGRPGGCQVPLRRSTALPSAGALPFAGPRSDGPRHRAGHGAAPSIRPRRPQSANLHLHPQSISSALGKPDRQWIRTYCEWEKVDEEQFGNNSAYPAI